MQSPVDDSAVYPSLQLQASYMHSAFSTHSLLTAPTAQDVLNTMSTRSRANVVGETVVVVVGGSVVVVVVGGTVVVVGGTVVIVGGTIVVVVSTVVVDKK